MIFVSDFINSEFFNSLFFTKNLHEQGHWQMSFKSTRTRNITQKNNKCVEYEKNHSNETSSIPKKKKKWEWYEQENLEISQSYD